MFDYANEETSSQENTKYKFIAIAALALTGSYILIEMGSCATSVADKQVRVTSDSERREVYIEAIRSVLLQDKAAADLSRSEVSTWNWLSGTAMTNLTDKAVKSMQAIDLDRCPGDFQKVYRDHIKAWEGMSAAAHAGSELNTPYESVITTWYEVKRCVGKYGLEVPKK